MVEKIVKELREEEMMNKVIQRKKCSI